MDSELSVRAGLNIGIETTLLPFVQAAVAEILPIAPSGDTVIAESTKQAARVLFVIGENIDNHTGGWLWNPNLDNVDVRFFFKDELGNEIPITDLIDMHADVGPIEINFLPNSQDFDFFCLAPGEQIIAQLSPHGR